MLTWIRQAAHRFYMKHFYTGRQPGSSGRGLIGVANAIEDLGSLRMAMWDEIKALRLAAGMNPEVDFRRDETTGRWVRDPS